MAKRHKCHFIKFEKNGKTTFMYQTGGNSFNIDDKTMLVSDKLILMSSVECSCFHSLNSKSAKLDFRCVMLRKPFKYFHRDFASPLQGITRKKRQELRYLLQVKPTVVSHTAARGLLSSNSKGFNSIFLLARISSCLFPLL